MKTHRTDLETPSPQEVVWRRMATEMFSQGASEDQVQQALRKAGCLALIRRQICEQTRHLVPVDRAANRREGLRAFVIGTGLCALGVLLLTAIALTHDRSASESALAFGGRRVALFSWGLLAAGFTPMLFGLWKLLTGSATSIVPTRR